MGRIEATFQDLQSRGEKALITFLTAGDPNLACTEQLIHALVEAGVDIIELGFPFSDPMADGPTIQLASERALASGTNLAGILSMVRDVRKHTNTPIVLMGYYNPILHYEPARFAQEAAAAGVDGLLLVDLPPEEEGEIRPFFEDAGICLITLIAPTTPLERSRQLAQRGQGFLYYVSMTGVTGSQQVNATSIEEAVHELQSLSPLPVAVGFGIASPSDAEAVARFADGVVVGSALVRVIAEHGDSPSLLPEVKRFVSDLKEAVRSASL